MIYVEGNDPNHSVGCCKSVRPGREPLVKLTIINHGKCMSLLLEPDAAMRLGTTLGQAGKEIDPLASAWAENQRAIEEELEAG